VRTAVIGDSRDASTVDADDACRGTPPPKGAYAVSVAFFRDDDDDGAPLALSCPLVAAAPTECVVVVVVVSGP